MFKTGLVYSLQSDPRGLFSGLRTASPVLSHEQRTISDVSQFMGTYPLLSFNIGHSSGLSGLTTLRQILSAMPDILFAPTYNQMPAINLAIW
jgi:hypothetical protein